MFNSIKKFILPIICLLLLPLIITQFGNATENPKNVKLFMTSDIHSYFSEDYDIDSNNQIIEHGNSAKLATLLKQRRDNTSLYLDGGDFAMGTLLQSGFTDQAYELRLLGQLGCDVTTLGNHEFDTGPEGLASMLNNAKAKSTKLPEISLANINVTNDNLKKAFDDYGVKPYTIKEVNGVKVGIFGIEGEDSIDSAPTNDQNWSNSFETAKQIVAELKDKTDLIVCLSHSGSDETGEHGPDIDLIKQVPDIDICLSAHSHYSYKPIKIHDSYIIGNGCYLQYLEQLNLKQKDNGKWDLEHYEKIPIAGNVPEDQEIGNLLTQFDHEIKQNYLTKYSGNENAYDQIAYCPYTYAPVPSMLNSDEEYPMQDIIADSYMYAAKQNDINDIDFSIVGIGTVRSNLIEGPIYTEHAFKICSLGIGSDGSAGHPLCIAYATGKDIRLFVEIETSLGKLKDGVKMAYNGLQVTWNSNRMIMDKVTDIKIKREDGSLEDIDDNKQYKFIANLYALNMLKSVNNLSKGLIKIAARDKDGNEITNFYDVAAKNKSGVELKEWVALKNYLEYLKVIPEKYSGPQGRKINTQETGLAAIAKPGPATIAVIVISLLFILVIVLIARKLFRHFRKH
ncbi:MAG: 5'-nucleotidase C-terminal domain-containing protein [Coriobacteriia bacterium]|nr:5'-nucleotidase C-terminal domain-containing protein [Coriobacteriia bacterium]